MSSTPSASQEVTFPVTATATAAMPRLATGSPSPGPLSDIFLTEIDDNLSALQDHPTIQYEPNSLSERDTMNTTLFRPRRVVSGSSEGTVYISPNENELQDEPHEFPHFREVPSDEDPHNDAYSSDQFFDDEGPTSAQKTQTRPAAKKKRLSSSQPSKPTSSASARAKRHRKAQDHEQNTSPMLNSSPYSERIRVKRPKSQDSEDGDVDFDSEEVTYESVEEVTKKVSTPASGRTLRKKTIQQTHPYQFEKIQYNLEKATGVAAIPEDIEEMIDSTPRTKPKTRRSSGRLTGSNEANKTNNKNKGKNDKTAESKRGRSGSLVSVTSYVNLVDILEKTTIQIWLDGFAHAAAPVMLSKVKDIDQLIDRMIDNWDWKFEGKVFSHAIASFPWLSKESNILIRPGMTDSFVKLLGEVEASPTWTEKADDKVKSCEVKVTVFLRA